MTRFILIIGFIIASTDSLPAGMSLKVYFSPRGGARDAIVEKINGARKYIDVAMYCFTSRHLAQALVRAKKRGVKVRVLLDRECAQGKFSKEKFLRKHGIQVKRSRTYHGLERFKSKYPPKMHHKFAVIDGHILITGSYNWTASAEISNYENLLVFENAGELADEFEKEFNALWRGKK